MGNLISENKHLRNNLHNEEVHRKTLERRNRELSEKLNEAKEALRETRSALVKVISVVLVYHRI